MSLDRKQPKGYRKAWNGSPLPPRPSVQHGVDCKKAPHIREGYLHAEDDDGPFDVDGIAYCGRCHQVIF